MKRSSMALLFAALVMPATTLPEPLAAQAYVDQANPTGGMGPGRKAYVDQLPAGARPRIQQRKPVAAQAPRRPRALRAAVVADAVVMPRVIPNVGAGASFILRSGDNSDWPTVGQGTVRKAPSR